MSPYALFKLIAGVVPPLEETGEVPVTDVTVPPLVEAAMVIEPAPLVIVTFDPAVRVVRVNPVPLPMSIWPFDGEVVKPVPPLATGNVPVTPVDNGKPVTLVITPEAGVPKAGVTNVGPVANTTAPVPVSPITAAAKFALVGLFKNVAIPEPSELTPVPPDEAGNGVPRDRDG